jgi:hypothetical protein
MGNCRLNSFEQQQGTHCAQFSEVLTWVKAESKAILKRSDKLQYLDGLKIWSL